MSWRAVIFDLGGVVLDSPLHAIAAYEREHGLPPGFVNRVVVETGPQGAWSRLERGEIPREVFERAFDAECRAAGHTLSSADLMARIATCQPRAEMLEAIGRIRRRRVATAALTNNWAEETPRSVELRPHFDVFVESSVVGLRKPDPAIYLHTCGELGIEPREAIFLDDIGRNLKVARTLGMETLKVEDPALALRTLSTRLGFALRAGPPERPEEDLPTT